MSDDAPVVKLFGFPIRLDPRVRHGDVWFETPTVCMRVVDEREESERAAQPRRPGNLRLPPVRTRRTP